MSVIKAEKLSKKFVISHESRERYTAMRDVLTKGAKKIFSFPKKLWSGTYSAVRKEEFWALKDLNFEINQGDRVGIVGRNGAGKSTLLKVLSRITPPTEGKVSFKGRVASLLEVGTGFHPELTGRENIFLNGAILGMSRAEIRKKFDEIVAFAEVEKFLDTPVKRYSSGMYVRLAFSVAAHLEPEILIVDEVLAVGDALFQKKCLGKMGDITKQGGGTVLFVSHQLNALKAVCATGLLLEKGKLIKEGDILEVLNTYEKDQKGDSNLIQRIETEKVSAVMEINKTQPLVYGRSLEISIHLHNKGNPMEGVFSIAFDYVDNIRCLTLDSPLLMLQTGETFLNLYFQSLTITPGLYNMIFVFRNKANTNNLFVLSNTVTVHSDQDTPVDVSNCRNHQGGFRQRITIRH